MNIESSTAHLVMVSYYFVNQHAASCPRHR